MKKCKCWWRWPGDGNGWREVKAAIGGGWEIQQDEGENLMALSRKKGWCVNILCIIISELRTSRFRLRKTEKGNSIGKSEMKTNTENFDEMNVKRNENERIAVYEIRNILVKTKEKDDKRATNFKENIGIEKE